MQALTDESGAGRVSRLKAMRKTTFKWLAALAAGAALFDGCALLLMTSGHGCGVSKVQCVKADFQSIGSAVRTYILNGGCPPSSSQGLEVLLIRPTTEPLPDDWVQLMDKIPTDPWRQPYHYRKVAGKPGLWRWELRSRGLDGKLWTSDDLFVVSEFSIHP